MYFFDTYAIIEAHLGNPSFSKFGKYPLIVSFLNVAEFYEYLMREYGSEAAENKMRQISFEIIQPNLKTIKDSVNFRQEKKKNHISWADCIGYCLAKENGIKFLTGDKEFRDLP